MYNVSKRPGVHVLRKSLFVAAVSLFTSNSYAELLTLEQTLSLAKENSANLTIIQKERLAGDAEMDIYRSDAFPMINFGSGVSYVSQSMKSQGLQSGEAAAISDRIDGYSANWALNLQQPLITFGKVSSALKLSRYGKKTLDNAKSMQEDQFYLKVMQHFSTAYEAQYDKEITEKSNERSQRLLARTKAEFETGTASKADYLRVEALAENNRAELLKANYLRNSSLRLLCVLIGRNDTIPTTLILDQKGALSTYPSETGETSSLTELKLLESNLYKEQSRYYRSTMYPSISLTGSITNQFLIVDTTGLTEPYLKYIESTKVLDPTKPAPTISASEQSFPNPKVSSFFDPDYFNYSIGLQLSWNIFDSKRTLSQIKQARYKSEKAKLEHEQLLKENKVQIEEERNMVSTIDQMFESVLLNVTASEKALVQTESDYNSGMTDITALLEAESNYRNSLKKRDNLSLQRVLSLASLRLSMGMRVYGE